MGHRTSFSTRLVDGSTGSDESSPCSSIRGNLSSPGNIDQDTQRIRNIISSTVLRAACTRPFWLSYFATIRHLSLFAASLQEEELLTRAGIEPFPGCCWYILAQRSRVKLEKQSRHLPILLCILSWLKIRSPPNASGYGGQSGQITQIRFRRLPNGRPLGPYISIPPAVL